MRLAFTLGVPYPCLSRLFRLKLLVIFLGPTDGLQDVILHLIQCKLPLTSIQWLALFLLFLNIFKRKLTILIEGFCRRPKFVQAKLWDSILEQSIFFFHLQTYCSQSSYYLFFYILKPTFIIHYRLSVSLAAIQSLQSKQRR